MLRLSCIGPRFGCRNQPVNDICGTLLPMKYYPISWNYIVTAKVNTTNVWLKWPLPWTTEIWLFFKLSPWHLTGSVEWLYCTTGSVLRALGCSTHSLPGLNLHDSPSLLLLTSTANCLQLSDCRPAEHLSRWRGREKQSHILTSSVSVHISLQVLMSNFDWQCFTLRSVSADYNRLTEDVIEDFNVEKNESRYPWFSAQVRVVGKEVSFALTCVSQINCMRFFWWSLYFF